MSMGETMTKNGCGENVSLAALGTERGRAEIREMVQRAVSRGWCRRPPDTDAPPEPPRKTAKHRPTDGAAVLAAAARLPDGFGRADLMRAARLDEVRAANVMTAWRKSGWIVGDRTFGWTRTAAFGQPKVDQ